MQWKKQRKIVHVIGSSNHVLLVARYQDAPLGEEDEEEGSRKGYEKAQENGTSSRNERTSPGGYKPRRNGTGSSSSGYGSGGSRSRRGDDQARSPSQPKIMFNEEEYTRITTPRQDVLFKKGYLSQKKPWASTASTSATPSTTESQSASHSTADGSETTEDQQLLENGVGEYAPVMEPPAQLGYGTFYDHNSGFYYEYPVMLVGPTAPEQMNPNYLAAMPCNAVPLRSIEWVNPTYVPKSTDSQYCMMDYQAGQNPDCAVIVDAQGAPVPTEAVADGTEDTRTRVASRSGSVAEEEFNGERDEEQEQFEGNFIDAASLAQPVPLPHMIPPMTQPYMYPGQYMFGPQLVNVNGVTVQSSSMIRYGEVVVTNASSACAKRRKKKKRRKQRRIPNPENEEDEEEEGEEGEEDGEEDEEEEENLETDQNRSPSSRLQWPGGQEAQASTTAPSNRPLNPECQEFTLRTPHDLPEQNDACKMTVVEESSKKSSDKCQDNDLKVVKDVSAKPKRLTNDKTNSGSNSNCVATKPETNSKSNPGGKTCSRARSSEINHTTTPINAETKRLPESYESLVTRPPNSRRKYNKNSKFVREPTPVPDLDSLPLENATAIEQNATEAVRQENKDHPECSSVETKEEKGVQNEGSCEDSGFESQTREKSKRPITEAVNEWLRQSSSPDIFITKHESSESEEDEEDEDEEEKEKQPPKNLQGNPMPALSASGNANEMSRSTSCGKFARPNHAKEHATENERTKRKRRRSKKNKKKLGKVGDCKPSECEKKVEPMEVAETPLNVGVGVDCEFTEKDSVAGMRVAPSSRMNTKRRWKSQLKDSSKSNQDLEIKKARMQQQQHHQEAVTLTHPVRTFESGQVVVSVEGKLLPISRIEPFLLNGKIPGDDVVEGVIMDSEETENNEEDVASLGSIVEPDVLDCWEAETVEAVVTPKKLVNSKDVENEVSETNTCLDVPQKYYKIVQGSDETMDLKILGENSLDSSMCSEDSLPPFQSLRNPSPFVEEAFEAYESCYNSKAPLFRGEKFLGRDQESAIPCRIVCCNIQ